MRCCLFLALAPMVAFAADPPVVELWPGAAPDEIGNIGPERVRMSPVLDRKQVEVTESTRLITGVTKPTLTIYRPAKEWDTGTAILICPGGGYWNLYWQLEGEEVAAWLNSIGITGIILKYRVPRRPDEPEKEPARRPLQDAQRAISLARSKAGEWDIRPDRIGIIGFSAGGHLAIATATSFEKRTYAPIDGIDKASCRPDFAIPVYSGYLKAKDKDELASDLRIPQGTPPIFLVHGSDDVISPPENSALMYLALKRAGIPAELHIYANTTHDFGVRQNNRPYAAWTTACALWLRDLGTAQHTARVETEQLRVVIADNEPYGPTHRAGYNGVAELSLQAAGAKNLFVPQYAGLNLEHIFSGDAQSFGWNIFEPRRAPMQLLRRSTNRVELQQERTEHWPLRSRLIYEVTNDAVDLTYCGTPLADAWQRHGYIGVFFASYIDRPEDMSLQFIGRCRGDTRTRWVKHLPPKHGVAANHRPVGSTWDPRLDDGFNIELVKGVSEFEYAYPFYFGRSGENVFVMMFERPGADREIRFAQSPSGGGTGNPAWDFIYYQRAYTVNREFCFRARAVLRKFTNTDDIIRLYEQWSGERVVRPPE